MLQALAGGVGDAAVMAGKGASLCHKPCDPSVLPLQDTPVPTGSLFVPQPRPHSHISGMVVGERRKMIPWGSSQQAHRIN